MGNINEHQLMAQIASGIVAELAPQELPTFSVIGEAYFKNPEKMRKGLSGKEEILGLDIVGTATLILSPVVLAIVDTIVSSLVEEVGDSSFFKRLMVKLHFAKKAEKKIALPLSLTREQLLGVREKAIAQAVQFNLSRKQAELLADSLIGKLALIEQ